MPKTDERIEALNKTLDESKVLYEDSKRQYDTAVALYEQSKMAVVRTELFAKAINNNSLDPAAALQKAASFTPNPQGYLSRVNQPGADPQKLKQELLEETKKENKVAKAAENKAKKEVQKAAKAIEGTEKQIDSILQQLEIATSGVTLKKKAEVAEKTNKIKVKSRTKKVKLNSALIDAQTKRAAITAVAKSAALFVIAKVLNREVQRLSKTVQQLTELVDKVNDQILSIQTKQDVLKARITRDAAVVELAKAKRQITTVRNIIRTLETLLTILSLAAKIAITFVQLPTTPLAVQKIVNLILTIDSVTIILGTTKSALNDLIIEVEYQESRLLPISDVIDKALDENLTPDEIRDLLNGGNNNNIGNVVYRGFTFAIYDENNPKFEVANNKRKYAVALDRSGFIRLRSQSSFTLNPSVLIEELKLQIDEQNLEA
jgi:hypothetical protein